MTAKSQHTVYLGLGANLGDRVASLEAAISGLAAYVTINNVSSVWDTAPQLVTDQPRFLNAALVGTTTLDPFELLHALKRLEEELGRRPNRRYGPRAIDIDVLFYDEWLVDSQELTIPHPMLAQRAFVLAPLAEIAPNFRHPRIHGSITELVASVAAQDIRRLDAGLTR
jgi:2-amino-4-hydroxy-6-hydroxymethyldihydropteridine diphosphokinase